MLAENIDIGRGGGEDTGIVLDLCDPLHGHGLVYISLDCGDGNGFVQRGALGVHAYLGLEKVGSSRLHGQERTPVLQGHEATEKFRIGGRAQTLGEAVVQIVHGFMATKRQDRVVRRIENDLFIGLLLLDHQNSRDHDVLDGQMTA